MRNALICAGVMLAMLLAWPLVFGAAGGAPAKASQAIHAGSMTRMPVPPAAAWRRPLQRDAAATRSGGESTCFRRYQAVFDACPQDGAVTCRRSAFDDWDVCEATGFWPEQRDAVFRFDGQMRYGRAPVQPETPVIAA